MSTKSQQIDISIFIPCLNEAENIIGTLDNTITALKAVNCSYEILVVDDGSTDNTSEVVQAYRQAHSDEPIKLHRNSSNQGIARSFLAGTEMTTGKYYRMVCGDNVEDNQALQAAFELMGQADMVLVYPAKTERTLKRQLISKTYNTLVNFVGGYNIRYYNGVPITHRERVAEFVNVDAGFGFFAELVVRMLDQGASYVEVGVHHQERQSGESKALTFRNLRGIAKMFLRLLRFRLQRLLPSQQNISKQVISNFQR